MEPPLQFATYHLRGFETMGELRGMVGETSGVYVLHFFDSTQYVGKTEDINDRFGAHVRTWEKRIVRIDFAEVPFTRIGLHEVLTIFHRQAEGVVLENNLHNKTIPLRPDGAPVRDLEAVEGIRWALLASEDEVSQRPARLRQRPGAPARPATDQLLTSPAAGGALQVLNTYVTQVLRCPADTEWTYWKVWVPARRRTDNGWLLAKLIVRNEVLLYVWEHQEGFVYAQAKLHHYYKIDPAYEPVLTKRPNPSKVLQDTALHQDDFCRALHEDPDYLAAARAIARELMVDGPCTKGDVTHDWALADAIFSALPYTTQGNS